MRVESVLCLRRPLAMEKDVERLGRSSGRGRPRRRGPTHIPMRRRRDGRSAQKDHRRQHDAFVVSGETLDVDSQEEDVQNMWRTVEVHRWIAAVPHAGRHGFLRQTGGRSAAPDEEKPISGQRRSAKCLREKYHCGGARGCRNGRKRSHLDHLRLRALQVVPSGGLPVVGVRRSWRTKEQSFFLHGHVLFLG